MTGTYTDIREIVAPSSAAPGETVPVTVKVKNINGYWDHYIWLIVVFYDIYGEMQSVISEMVIIGSLETHSFSGSFTMPSCDTIIDAFTYYPEYQEWIFDDRKSKDISLAEVLAGTINRMELEYDEARADIPAYNIPQGQRGLVHIWGRNDMTTKQRMGISWTVVDPDGGQVESYSTWEAWPYTSPGDDHEFIGGRFLFDKPGTYRISVALYMNPDSPKLVDSYTGTLCTVAAAVPEPSFRGFGVTEYVTV
ncbi:hypothetical protein ES703_104982 [subsurface metagenome]